MSTTPTTKGMCAMNTTANPIFADDPLANTHTDVLDALDHTPFTCAEASTAPTIRQHPQSPHHHSKNHPQRSRSPECSASAISISQNRSSDELHRLPSSRSSCGSSTSTSCQQGPSFQLQTVPTHATVSTSFTDTPLFQQQVSSYLPSTSWTPLHHDLLQFTSSPLLPQPASSPLHQDQLCDADASHPVSAEQVTTHSSQHEPPQSTSSGLLQHSAPPVLHQGQLCNADALQPDSSMQNDVCDADASHPGSVDQLMEEEDGLNCYDLSAKSWPTPLIYHRFEYYLQGYDYHKKQSLLDNISNGVRIHSYLTPELSQDAIYNHSSAIENSQFVSDKIQSELSHNRIAGPFSKKPPGLIVSPLASVCKKEPGKFRLIHNLSFPKHSETKFSVNSLVPKYHSQVSLIR